MAVYFLPKSRIKKFLGRTDLPEDVMPIDVSNKSTAEWNVLSPAYNHGDIPVPGMPGRTARSVDGIWEGLKKYSDEEPNLSFFDLEKAKKRRLTKDTGKVIGYLYGTEILRDEVEARRMIFIPAYTWMVRNCPAAKAKFDELVELSKKHTLHIYDNEENSDVHDPKPFAYASLLTEMLKEARKAKAALV